MPRLFNRYDQGWNDALRVAAVWLGDLARSSQTPEVEKPGIERARSFCYRMRKEPEEVRRTGFYVRKYAISRRTFFYWKASGCPFQDGQRSVMQWLWDRRQLPPRLKEKFKDQLSGRDLKVILRNLRCAEREYKAFRRDLKRQRRRA